MENDRVFKMLVMNAMLIITRLLFVNLKHDENLLKAFVAWDGHTRDYIDKLTSN